MKPIKIRKQLCADGLIRIVKSSFEKIRDHRENGNKIKISLSDALMSAYAMFFIKSPSLLHFERKVKDENLKNIFSINEVPSDTQMRKILDDLNPDKIRAAFKDVFRQVQRGKDLERMTFYDGCYLLSMDGTGYFSSDSIHCPNCLEKKSSKTGHSVYYHQMLGAALVHPDLKEVIPFYPEPIIKQDGATKNDCERNAAKRFLDKFRKDHPYLPVIIVEDGLSSNAPHIYELKKHNCHYILGAKEGDHKFLFEQLNKGNLSIFKCITKENSKETSHEFRFINQIPLNSSNLDLLVNFVEYTETKPTGKKQHFSWITDFEVSEDNIFQIMLGGRARWRIENETFNTLKNQGYNLEHNYGHGNNNLSSVLAALMMLAFLTDQVQQLTCKLFNLVWEKEGAKRDLWESIRFMFLHFVFNSIEHLFNVILYGEQKLNLEIAKINSS
ncbi:MAG: transposase [Nanoarchaeota archaeon]|nr:transposase [Nanoarchaeota archaeon]